MHIGHSAGEYKESFYNSLRSATASSTTRANWTSAGSRKKMPAFFMDPITARKYNEQRKVANYIHNMVNRLSKPKTAEKFEGRVIGKKIQIGKK